MRHSRSGEFAKALAHGTDSAGPTHWTEVAKDPNDAQAVVTRARLLQSAWRPPITDRLAFLESRCRDRRVLDIGCVAHDAARMQSPDWAHRRLASVAAKCVGVDVLDEGVAAMRQLGFTAVAHDLTTGLGPVTEDAPFDVIVAGELIEHVSDVGMIFRVAAEALADDGELIVTTPNPYTPARVRAARRGIVWENVDHIFYAFPSGIAELCDRHGLVLAEAMVTDYPTARQSPSDRLRALRRRLGGTRWVPVGIATKGPLRVRRLDGGAVRRMLERRRRGGWFVGETFIYVVRRCAASTPRA